MILVALGVLIALLSVNAITCSDKENSTASDTPRPTLSLDPTVILVSLDGFRADYLDRFAPPTLQRLATEGIRSDGLIPSFPSKTFPNHYTIVTGLHPENHGIVSNTMYDPAFDASFSMSNREAVRDARWWGGEPIWVTLEKQGQKSAPLFWVGSEAPIQGVRPSYWLPFDDGMAPNARIRQVMEWLLLPRDRRPTFLTLYFSDVDSKSHRFGPDAEETAQAVSDVDGYLGLLVDQLEQHGLYDQVNIIVTSDHGMASTSSDRVIFLDDFIALDDVDVIDYDPVAMIRPRAGKLESVYAALQQAPHLSVYKKQETPEALHFRTHRRIPPLIGIAEEGWRISTHAYFDRNPTRFDGGTHGYDHRLPSMRALFIARGPSFAANTTVGPFANIHVYNLMTAILGVEPAPNDGDLDTVRHLLKADD